MRDLAVIVPSRGRPANAKRLAQEFCRTSSHVAHLYIVVDIDDERLFEYTELDLHEICSHVHVHTLDRRLRLGPTLNWMCAFLKDDFTHFGFMGDDHVPITEAWDQYVVDALQDVGLGVVYGDDLVHGEALPTAFFITGSIVRTLGYMVPPSLTHLFLDNYAAEIGRRVHGLKYLPRVVIEHRHPLVGKAEQDAGYAEVNSAEMWVYDQEAFNTYVAENIDSAVAKLLRTPVQ